MVSSGEESIAVELRSPCFRNRADHHRALLFFRTEVRRQHLELLNEVGVRIDGCVAIAARVGDVRAVRSDVQRVCGQAVVGECGIQWALAPGITVGIDSDCLAVVIRLVLRAVFDAESGNNLDILGGVAAHLRKVLEFFGCQRKGFFA